MADRMEPADTGPGPGQPGKTAIRFRLGAAAWLRPRAKGAARLRAVEVMLGQNRALVAEEIARAILESQAAEPPGDPVQRARGEQARIDAATARRIGKHR